MTQKEVSLLSPLREVRGSYRSKFRQNGESWGLWDTINLIIVIYDF